jgi:hypothetical protein
LELPSTLNLFPLPPSLHSFYDHDYGMLPGTSLPRMLDMGQCNDAYSAIVVASKLAEVRGRGGHFSACKPLHRNVGWLPASSSPCHSRQPTHFLSPSLPSRCLAPT